MGAASLGRRINGVIMAQTDRDKQVMIGPSNLGTTCKRCLGLALAGILPDGPRAPQRNPSQGLSAWIGTAMHLKLEQDVAAMNWPGVMVEKKHLIVGEIKGYGIVKGTSDVVSVKDKCILDYKGSKKAYIAQYRLHGVPFSYRVQRQSYAVGAVNLGIEIKQTGNKFLPRDSNSFDDIWDDFEPFNPAIVDDALERAAEIWKKYVKKGRVELLPSEPGCMNCSPFNRNVRFVRG